MNLIKWLTAKLEALNKKYLTADSVVADFQAVLTRLDTIVEVRANLRDRASEASAEYYDISNAHHAEHVKAKSMAARFKAVLEGGAE